MGPKIFSRHFDEARVSPIEQARSAFSGIGGFMRKKCVSAIAALLICYCCASSRASPVSPYCLQLQFCLFNQGPAANDPAGIHKYSDHLIGLIVPDLG